MKSTLEIGTGWYPVVPIALFLSGADRICTIDISPLMTHANILTTIDRYLQYADSLKLYDYIQPQQERLEQLRTISQQAQT